MVDAVKKERVEKYFDYEMPNPTTVGELTKTMFWAKQDAEAMDIDTSYGDWLTVTADDEHITLSWRL